MSLGQTHWNHPEMLKKKSAYIAVRILKERALLLLRYLKSFEKDTANSSIFLYSQM